MFDSQMKVKTAIRRSHGPETITVKFPDDEQWADWFRRRKVISTSHARGQTKLDIDTGEADLRLYEQIREPGSADLVAAEATEVVERIALREVAGGQVDADKVTVDLRVFPDQITTHRVRIPTTEEAGSLKRSTDVINLRFGQQQFKQSIHPSVKLYDACQISTENYANGVPAIHKDEVIRAALQLIEDEAAQGNQ